MGHLAKTDARTEQQPEQLEWYSEVPRSIRLFSLGGLTMLALSFGSFGYWSATAPLTAAVVAQGSFVATGNNKIIQHLEGGIIKDLKVSEGDTVKEGDVLLELDPTAAEANERMLNLRRLRLEAVIARLNAEALGTARLVLPEIVMREAGDPQVDAIIQSQRTIFQSRRTKLEEQLSLIDRNIGSLGFRNAGYRGQKEAFQTQVKLLQDERDSKAEMVKSGIARKTDLMAIDRAIADAMGDLARLDAEINEGESQIARYRQEAVVATNTMRQEALDLLQTAEADLESVREQAQEAVKVLERTVIRSPVSGTVIRSYFHTAGGVITTGKPIMEILPVNVPLIIEAQVYRTSIDQLREGEDAAIRLTALNRRTTPVLSGRVFYVSADSVETGPTTTQKDVYVVRVAIPRAELDRIPGFRPVPGMPADVLIQTASRTFLEYLVKPVTDSMSRAFKER